MRALRSAWPAPLLAAVLLAAAPSGAQEGAPFLFVNQERILTGSEAGQRLLAEEEREREALRAEARAIDTAFEEEEQALTAQRAELTPEEFRARADDFDARVVAARREQDERSALLAQRFDLRRRQFYAAVAPILVRLMDRFGARAILDETSVLLADESISITDEVIAEIDAGTDAGTDTGTDPGQGAGEPEAPETTTPPAAEQD